MIGEIICSSEEHLKVKTLSIESKSFMENKTRN